jgi:hypothetical protein
MHQCDSSANLHKATPVSAFSTMDNATTDHNANDLFYSDAEMGNLIHIKNEFEREFPVWTLFPTQRQLIDAANVQKSNTAWVLCDLPWVLCSVI